MEVGDRRLVARIVAGDDDALREALQRHGALVLGIARRVTGSTPFAEEVVQEVFTSLWCHPERFDSTRGSLRAYLGVQAQRRAVDMVRSECRRQAREERSAALGAANGVAGTGWWTGDGGGDEMALDDTVRAAIERLPDEQRMVVELAFWQERTCREVAELLGIPEGTAKSRLRLAQRKLSQWLAPMTAVSG